MFSAPVAQRRGGGAKGHPSHGDLGPNTQTDVLLEHWEHNGTHETRRGNSESPKRREKFDRTTCMCRTKIQTALWLVESSSGGKPLRRAFLTLVRNILHSSGVSVKSAQRARGR